MAGVMEEGLDHSFFGINIGLSKKGLENVNEIIKICYQYINLLKEHGVQEWVFQEEKKLKEISFRFLEESQPSDYACAVSGWMQSFPQENILSGTLVAWVDDLLFKVPTC